MLVRRKHVMNTSVLLVAYSIAEFAQMLGVSPQLIRTELKAGNIRSYRVGRRVLIPRTEITRLERAVDVAAR